jgi:hypothetical protein|tara:strand:+ start:227 stop:1555 length:1329 start_codon:yes stop_codon:yes gene_type:complete
MRFQKLKAASMGSLAGSLAHTMRSRYTPNADPELIKDNKVWLGPENTADVIQAVRDRWPEKHRKDAVGCIEYFIGASPEWFKKHGGHGDQDAYFQHAIDWLKAEYGEENVVSVVQHNDETSPHLAAYVVPVDEYGKLNAKQWTGGRAACARMQTRFQEAAGEPVGLERGIRGSKAEHLTIQRWYEQNKTVDQREQTVYGEEIGLEIREQALREQSDAHSSEIREMESAVKADREAVREREQEVARKAAELAQKAESLSSQANALDERENAVQRKSDALQKQSEAVSKKERQLSALERELSSRGETLAGGEAALEKRQAAIDAAGEKLRQRLESARQQQQAFEAQNREFEQQRAAWLESNRPRMPQVPELVAKLRAVGDMGRQEALDFIYENDELLDYYSPIEGYNDEAKALLERYADDVKSEEAKRWERTVEPPKGFKPPEM